MKDFCTIIHDMKNPKGWDEWWVEVCLDGNEEADVVFYIKVPFGADHNALLKRIGSSLQTEPHEGVLVCDVLDPGWRNRPRHPSSDPDIPF